MALDFSVAPELQKSVMFKRIIYVKVEGFRNILHNSTNI